MIKAKSGGHKSLSEEFGVVTSVSVFSSMSHELNIAMHISTPLNGMTKEALFPPSFIPQSFWWMIKKNHQ